MSSTARRLPWFGMTVKGSWSSPPSRERVKTLLVSAFRALCMQYTSYCDQRSQVLHSPRQQRPLGPLECDGAFRAFVSPFLALLCIQLPSATSLLAALAVMPSRRPQNGSGQPLDPVCVVGLPSVPCPDASHSRPWLKGTPAIEPDRPSEQQQAGLRGNARFRPLNTEAWPPRPSYSSAPSSECVFSPL